MTGTIEFHKNTKHYSGKKNLFDEIENITKITRRQATKKVVVICEMSICVCVFENGKKSQINVERSR